MLLDYILDCNDEVVTHQLCAVVLPYKLRKSYIESLRVYKPMCL